MSKHEAQTYSRRSFLKGAGAALAGASVSAGIGLAGCAPAEDRPPADTGATPLEATSGIWALDAIGEPTETLQADVAIIGGGGTGTAAAIEASQQGLSVVLVDRGASFGGAFINTEGMLGINTSWTRTQESNPSVEEMVQKCMAYHHWVPNHGLYMNYFEQTAETVEWLKEFGIEYRGIFQPSPISAYAHDYENVEGSMPGALFMEKLGAAAEQYGITARFKTIAKKILVEDGKVTGLLAEDDEGTVIQVDAPVVILASGGYASNPDILYDLANLSNENIFSLGPEIRNGDGLKMARDAGAAFAASPGTIMWCGPVITGAGWTTDAYAASVQPTLWLNEKAERWCNEDLWVGDFAAAGIAQANQKRTYAILTNADIEQLETTGPYVRVFTWGPPGVPLPDVRSELERLSSVTVVDTIEETAEAASLDPEALRKTIQRYNGFCESGVDEDFGKEQQYLAKIEAPYWVCETSLGYYTTVGGIKVSSETEVLDEAGEPIGGLYAGGCDAGGLYGDSYDVSLAPGSQASWAINSGRIAAKQARKYVEAN